MNRSAHLNFNLAVKPHALIMTTELRTALGQ